MLSIKEISSITSTSLPTCYAWKNTKPLLFTLLSSADELIHIKNIEKVLIRLSLDDFLIEKIINNCKVYNFYKKGIK